MGVSKSSSSESEASLSYKDCIKNKQKADMNEWRGLSG